MTAYKTPIDICSYGNLDEIEAHNKREILAIQARRRRHNFEYEDEGEWPLEDNCLMPVHLTIIGETAVPVKFRVEIVDEREYFGIVEKMYCNHRILAFNEKTHLWDVSSCIYSVSYRINEFCNDIQVVVAHYSNFAVEEDEINYYKPHYDNVFQALYSRHEEGNETFRLQHDLFQIISDAANVPAEYRRGNTSCYVTLK